MKTSAPLWLLLEQRVVSSGRRWSQGITNRMGGSSGSDSLADVASAGGWLVSGDPVLPYLDDDGQSAPSSAGSK